MLHSLLQARPLLTQALDQEDFGDLVDPRLGNNFTASEMFRMIEAAAACVRHLAAKRPRMSQVGSPRILQHSAFHLCTLKSIYLPCSLLSQVVRALDSMDELADLNNGVRPGQSGIFNSREQSAQIRMFQRMAFGGSQDYSSEYFNNSQSSWRS